MSNNKKKDTSREETKALKRLMAALRGLREAWQKSDKEIRGYYLMGPQTGGFERLALDARASVAACLQEIWTQRYSPDVSWLSPMVVDLLNQIPSPEQLLSLPRPEPWARGPLWRETWEESGIADSVEKLLWLLEAAALTGCSNAGQKRRKYEEGIRWEVAAFAAKHPGMSYRELAKVFSISYTTLYGWGQLRRVKEAHVSDPSRFTGVVGGESALAN